MIQRRFFTLFRKVRRRTDLESESEGAAFSPSVLQRTHTLTHRLADRTALRYTKHKKTKEGSGGEAS